MTLGIYAKVIASGTDHGATLDDLVAGSFRHSKGTSASFGLIPPRGPDLHGGENPRRSRGSEKAADGIRTHDLLHGKCRSASVKCRLTSPPCVARGRCRRSRSCPAARCCWLLLPECFHSVPPSSPFCAPFARRP